MDPLDAEGQGKIDEAMGQSHQGDCVIGDHWFAFRISPDAPITEPAAVAAADKAENAEAAVPGFAVVTQTCDIRWKCVDRPFLEVCPLVEMDLERLQEIKSCKRPRFAYIAGVASRRLVADLDRVMTIEKSVAAQWQRIMGCTDEEEARRLAQALSRKRSRPAFPDDFVALASDLTSRMSAKHDKNSEEGRALRALREIRVRAAPSWDSHQVQLDFWFIRRDGEAGFEGKGWNTFLEKWLSLVPQQGRFSEVNGLVVTLEDLRASEYIESDPLDLDHLSTREG